MYHFNDFPVRYHNRVLYIDTDVHHGDGVEEAFYTTDRVMTLSLHKFGEFFPGTGASHDIGFGRGRGYSVNIPLNNGIDDESYRFIFDSVVQHVMDFYRPGAVVLQLGADSLVGDRLGAFNLSMQGHAHSVEFLKKFNVPVILLGGGGYTIRNVARAWTFETSVAAGVEVSEELPFHEYFDYYGPEYRLAIPASNMENMNTRQYLEKLRREAVENMRNLPHAPSVQYQDVPVDGFSSDDEEFTDENEYAKDRRISQRQSDAYRIPANGLSDSEDEGDNRRDRTSYRDRKRGGATAERSGSSVTPMGLMSGRRRERGVGGGGGGGVGGGGDWGLATVKVENDGDVVMGEVADGDGGLNGVV
ncbi:Histone deacetylase 2 [Rhizophlyctis rosea]|nr:Histone deacetylase 2 [Rhizophlyctis rosea]